MSERSGLGDEALRGVRAHTLRERNAALVFRVVREMRAVSRAEISTASGLSPGAVTKIVSQLSEAGLLRAAPQPLGEREPGRPRLPLELDTDHYRVAGVHVGLRRTTVGLTDLLGEPVAETIVEHRSNDPELLINEATSVLAGYRADLGERLLATGFCTGGWVDATAPLVRSHSVLGWRDVSLAPIQAAAGVPTFFDSSVRAHAQAEVQFGNARGLHNLLYVFIGNVVGAAHVVDGEVARGANGAAGTIDHWPVRETAAQCACGRNTCFWGAASDVAVASTARAEALISADEHVAELVQRSLTEDGVAAQARGLLRSRAEAVGEAVASLVDFVDPETVVIGGTIRSDEELAAIRRSLEAHASPATPLPEVAGSDFADAAVVRAAATVALVRVYADPLAFVAA